MRKLGIGLIFSFIILLTISSLALTAKSQEEPSIIWIKTFDGGSSDQARSVAIDSQNNIILTGISVIETPQNFMTVKYDSNGNLLWNRTHTAGTQARSIAVDRQDNIVVTGYSFNGFTDSFLTIKYDQNGNLLWSKTYGEDMQGEGVAVDSQNNVIAVGYYYVEDNMNAWDIKIIKYDSNGNQIWERTYDDIEGEQAFSVAIDSQDNILITGMSYDGLTRNVKTIKYDKDGNLLWTSTYNGGYEDEGHSVAIDSMDNVVVTGFTSDATANHYFLTIKYDKNGNTLWTRTNREAQTDEANGIAVDSENNILVTGWSFDGTSRDLTIIGYDEDGNKLWDNSYRGSPTYGTYVELRGYGVAVDSANRIIVTGTIFYIIPQKPSDFFTIKYSALSPTEDGSTDEAVNTYDIVVDGDTYKVITKSNSTISDFQFIQADKKLMFNVTGPTGTNGFCNITIPNQLLGGPYVIVIDGQPIGTPPSFNNGTHTWLYITYLHSAHKIEVIGLSVIPEVRSITSIILFALATLIVVAFSRNKRSTKTHPK